MNIFFAYAENESYCVRQERNELEFITQKLENLSKASSVLGKENDELSAKLK